MKIIFSDEWQFYKDKLNVKIVDQLCKHVCKLESKKSRQYLSVADDIGYYNARWGYGEQYYLKEDKGLEIQISRVQRFIYDCRARAVRLVIDRDGHLWVDNLHTCLSYVLSMGDNISFLDIPFYLVDMSYNDLPIIVTKDSSVDLSENNINGILQCAEYRCNRVSHEMYSLNYTISDFIKDNKISRKLLTLEGWQYDAFNEVVINARKSEV